MLTCNNPEYNHDFVIGIMDENHCRYTFQKEEGEQGTPHFQIFALFESRKRFAQVRDIFERLGRPHIEVSRDPRRGEEYCRKEEGRLEGTVTDALF